MTEAFWDHIEEHVYLRNGHLEYDSIIWRSFPKPKNLNFDRLLDIASDNIIDDGEGGEYIRWLAVQIEMGKTTPQHKEDQ